ncbi:hypothetical protein N7535_005108 [Penicillium sp. DV-2018c]|nr:hypothetical protein N7461_008687 [Penicillium sp. DV-2018c]KAJ5571448.1 hypothetical protein N7535_005108 [Penicillium sp. DV-2018c]
MKYFKPLSRVVQIATTAHPIPLDPLRTTCHIQSQNRPRAEDKDDFFERCMLDPARSGKSQSGADDEVGRHKSPYDPPKKASVKKFLSRIQTEGHQLFPVGPANRDARLDYKARGACEAAPYAIREYENVSFDVRKPHEKVGLCDCTEGFIWVC